MSRSDWMGGNDGYVDAHDNPRRGWTFTYRSLVYRGLRVELRQVQHGTRRKGYFFQLAYGLGFGGMEWSPGMMRCTSISEALRRAEAMFDRLLPEAWARVWSRRTQVWKWDAEPARVAGWVQVSEISGGLYAMDIRDDHYGRGVYAMVRFGEPVHYVDTRWDGWSTSREPPSLVPTLRRPTDPCTLVLPGLPI